MLPLKLAVIPLLIELSDFGLLDTRLGLVFVYAAVGTPSVVFIMTGSCARCRPKAGRRRGSTARRSRASCCG